MSVPFTLRAAFCAATLCVLSACGGGGDSTGVATRDDALAAADARANKLPGVNDNQFYVLQTSAATAESYDFVVEGSPIIYDFGAYQAGYVTLTATKVSGSAVLLDAPVVKDIIVGHLKGDKTKFFVVAEIAGSTDAFQCVSSAWTDAEKAALKTASGGVEAGTCDGNISFANTPATEGSAFKMVRAPLYNVGGKAIWLNVNTIILPITFPTSGT